MKLYKKCHSEIHQYIFNIKTVKKSNDKTNTQANKNLNKFLKVAYENYDRRRRRPLLAIGPWIRHGDEGVDGSRSRQRRGSVEW